MLYNSDNNVSIENCLFKVYAIGSMEAPGKKDGGAGWRKRLTPELNDRGIYCFDPTREEIAKVGMPTEEFMEKLEGWQKSGHWNHFVEAMRKIWCGVSYTKEDKETKQLQSIHVFGDVSYVENSHFLIWNLDEGDKPGGTLIELAIAWYRAIPVYMITQMPKININKSILYFILDSGNGQGGIFPNQKQLLEFLDKKYKFDIQESLDFKDLLNQLEVE